MTDLRATIQQFISKMTYKDCYLPKTDAKLVELEYLAMENAGFVVVDKQALRERLDEQTLRTTPEVRRFIKELLEENNDGS